MHPESIRAHVAARQAELIEHAADHRRAAGLGRQGTTRRLRRRTGWWLIGVGLRLAVDRRSGALRSLPGPA
jgi:hypothetical protein